MYQSIQQFIEKDIYEIEKITGKVLTGEKDADHLSQEILDRTTKLASRMIAEMYEKIDEEIMGCIQRKVKWNIEKRNEPKEILDIVGTVRFNRTGYEDKKTGEYVYLLDRVLGLESHQRLTLGAMAKVLEETLLTSYRKGGKAASPYDAVSKQTVKRIVHGTVIEFPVGKGKKKEEKKQLKTLYIIADEAHVAAQFWKEKGDLAIDSRGNTINTLMPKLICVYEDIINESGENSKTPRYRLVGKKYFCGTYKGEADNLKLWEQVRDYIEETYDTDVLERVYIAGDGATWIKTGLEVIEGSKFVLDKYHMMKYINESVSHLSEDNKELMKDEIWENINEADKEGLKAAYQLILKVTESETKGETIKSALKYLLNQWDGIRVRVEEAGGNWKCCAEGQVSHVLSARMSSRPMGWSEHGCDQISKLLAYHWNGGKVIDLLRYQKKKQQKEKDRQEQEELIKELRKRQSGWEYAEQMQGAVPGLERQSMKWMRSIIGQAI